jgi:hypothetical protein
VVLVNPFGKPLSLPWEWCFSEDVRLLYYTSSHIDEEKQRLHEMLMTYFKGKCGEGHVWRHHYSISTEDGRSLVQSGNWGSVVKKGTVLVMSMIVEKAALPQESVWRQRNRCPNCYETDLGVMPDNGWFQW